MNVNIQQVIKIAKAAGEEILKIYGTDFSVYEKEDASPLTDADQRANDVIVKGLNQLNADIPIISEETKLLSYEERKDWELFWLVDPLDGTKEFVKRNGEFTVNIALVENGVPIAGVVHLPVFNKTYFAERASGAHLIDENGSSIQIKKGAHYLQKDKIIVVASRSHLSDAVTQFVEHLRAKGKDVKFLSAGSSLKICMVAEGKADVYPRLGPTMEWDTGAAHAVALEAGCSVNEHNSDKPLAYNKENLLNPWFIVT